MYAIDVFFVYSRVWGMARDQFRAVSGVTCWLGMKDIAKIAWWYSGTSPFYKQYGIWIKSVV